MKKYLTVVILLFLICLPVHASDYENVLFKNSLTYGLTGMTDFQKTTLTGGYEIRTEDRQKVLALTLGMGKDGNLRNAGVSMGNEDMEDYVLSAKIRRKTITGVDMIIYFNVISGSEYYALSVYSDGTIKLCKNSSTQEVSSDGIGSLPSNTQTYWWNNFKIKSVKGKIEVYVNNSDEPIIYWEDSEPLKNGKIGFGISGSSYAPGEVLVSDIKVVSASKQLPDDVINVLDNCIAYCIGSNKLFVNGNERMIDEDNPNVVPFIENDRAMVPLRALGESIGFDINYDDGKISLSNNEKKLQLEVNSKTCISENEKYEMQNAVLVKNDRSYVLIRDVAQLFNKKVLWRNNGIIIISDNDIDSVVNDDVSDVLKKNFGNPN